MHLRSVVWDVEEIFNAVYDKSVQCLVDKGSGVSIDVEFDEDYSQVRFPMVGRTIFKDDSYEDVVEVVAVAAGQALKDSADIANKSLFDWAGGVKVDSQFVDELLEDLNYEGDMA